jgi:hypothetical protein
MRIYITEGPQAVDTSKYDDINFKDRVVGSSTPTKDKINPSLLADVDKAAEIAGVKGSVTTAVSGHRPGSRHALGLAVDLAMFDGKGYHSKEDAKKKGIYDKIEKFVKALEGMGYKVNSESGNDKAVLWFGFPNHHHHVHVSRKSDDGESSSSSSSSSSSVTTTTTSSPDENSADAKSDKNLFQLLGIMSENYKIKNEKKVLSEIQKINKINKVTINEGALQVEYPNIASFYPSEQNLQSVNKNLLSDINQIATEKGLTGIGVSASTPDSIYVTNNQTIKTKLTEKGYGGGKTQNPNKYFQDNLGNTYVFNNTPVATTNNSTTTTTTNSSTTQTTTVAGKSSVLDKADVSSGEKLIDSALQGFLSQGLGLKENIESKQNRLLSEINRIRKNMK